MPVAAIYEISEDWWLGEALCDFWVCSDVLCCTASILHLVGIALDRYWAVTNAEYIRRRTGRRIGIMIGIFWFLSILISIPARFYTTRSYNYSGYSSNLNIKEPPDCRINQEHGYTIFSNIGAFYMPMIFIIGIYARIYQVARARIRRSAFKQSVSTSLCMSQRNQSHQRQPNKHRQSHSFKQYLSINWCCYCRNNKDKDSIKLTYSQNNRQSDTNTNQENPSSSHVVDTDCTMIGRNVTMHTIMPIKTIEMLNSNKSNRYFDYHRKSIPYADDVENKSVYYQSTVNLTENNCNTKIISLYNCEKQKHIISEYKANTDNTGCLYKHKNRKLSQKVTEKSNSLDGYECIQDLDFQEHTLLSRYRSSAPPILVHLNNSSTLFSELTNSNSQMSESSTENTNSAIWSSPSSSSSSPSSSSSSSLSSSSPLPSTPTSSFSGSLSSRVNDHCHYRYHHHHRFHHHRHRQHHYKHGRPIHHHFHRLHHQRNDRQRYNEFRMSNTNQNLCFERLKLLCPCCCCCCSATIITTSSSSSLHHQSHYNHKHNHQLYTLNTLQNENPTVTKHWKYLSHCCIQKHINPTSDYVHRSNNNNNNKHDNNNNEMYYNTIDQRSKISDPYHRQYTVITNTTTNTTNYNDNISNNSKKHNKSDNHISLKLTKKQFHFRRKLCHLFNLNNNSNNNVDNCNKKQNLTQSPTNLTSNINTDLSTVIVINPINDAVQQPHYTTMTMMTTTTTTTTTEITTMTTTLSKPNNLIDETIITSNLMPIQQTQVNRERLEAKRERKAILTLAIITGCFLLCWLPFFIVALTSPFTKNFTISKFGQSMILWLGYSNSLLNPIIYTIFSPDFRNAFRKILFGRYNLRSLSR
ncbi:hypothetical protein MN116_005838 [Schistosoma mekongi]|uniref:G-protein coupled receptors family 1 profile domain-containing protein n=1 Tax=Schistosoma mekongi TaxID=38744 RepID=A0AAE1ZA14_SCHME|nr:hypothetical protein MN116_005838 [Schistosoma mekongi]